MTEAAPIGSAGDGSARRAFGPADLVGVGAVLAAAAAYLVPVLLRGAELGPYYLLSTTPNLTGHPGTQVPVWDNSDLINQMVPWSSVAWQQVHAGHLPLWNPYGALGTPLAFNWQSSPFSLAAAAGYLAPLRDAFTVGVAVNLVVAGVGGYVLGRVLRLGRPAAAALGIVWELSGPFAAWLGYPFPSVLAWAGWIVAAGIVLLRTDRPARMVAALAVCVALATLGGQPEGLVVLGLAVVVFFAVYLLVPGGRPAGLPRSRAVARLAVGAVAGVGLAAPLILPSLQLTSGSIRRTAGLSHPLPAHTLSYLLFQGFEGLPEHGGGNGIGLSFFYYTETAAYVGIAAVVLAGIALATRRRRPHVIAFAAVAAVCLLLVFVSPATWVADHLPGIGSVEWGSRPLMPLAFALAALAAEGLDAVVRSGDARRSARLLLVGFGAAAGGLALFWVFGRGGLVGPQVAVRDRAFLWPVVEVAAGLAAGGLLWATARRGAPAGAGSPAGSGAGRPAHRRPGWTRTRAAPPVTAAVVALLVGSQALFLATAGAPLLQSSASGLPHPQGVARLQRLVGTSTVGFGFSLCGLGFTPDVNDAYGLHELADYDPSLPRSLFTAWRRDTGSSPGSLGYYVFCPVITTAAEAREFGVSYLLEGPGHPGPPGTTLVAAVGDETLWRVPGAATAALAPVGGGPGAGRPLAVDRPSPSSWTVTYASSRPAVLQLHLTDVPGLTATLDGRPLALHRLAGLMVAADVPAGHHTVAVRYWPATFTLGLAVAAATAAGLVVAVVVEEERRRRRRRHRAPDRSPAPPVERPAPAPTPVGADR